MFVELQVSFFKFFPTSVSSMQIPLLLQSPTITDLKRKGVDLPTCVLYAEILSSLLRPCVLLHARKGPSAARRRLSYALYKQQTTHFTRDTTFPMHTACYTLHYPCKLHTAHYMTRFTLHTSHYTYTLHAPNDPRSVEYW
jgi:hypothetical protein